MSTTASPEPARPQWDPQVYARYADHRSRPFFDLVERVRAEDPTTVVDLGCGSGELTATLAERWPHARVLGVDSSAAMLEKAARHADERVSFTVRDLETYLPDPDTDVVVSNAAYQWVEDNPTMIGRIGERLKAGGWLAVQVPGNFHGPSHELIRGLLAEPRWQDATGGLALREDPVLSAEAYGDLLAAHGLEVDTWETVYNQVLSGTDPVLEWVRGTALRPVLTRLADPTLGVPGADPETDFLTILGERLRAAYPARPYGVVFPFRRIFVIAHRAQDPA